MSDLAQDPFKPRLGNGSVATPADWPATVVAGTCTGTLIGPQVLITAAHCVGQGKKVSIKNSDFSGTCLRHAKWSMQNLSPDVALCLMSPMVRKGLFFESVELDATFAKAGQRLLMGGYGCTDLDTQKREDPAIFRIGPTAVAKVAGENAAWPNWLITSPATNATATFACPGDSGGAVYHVAIDGVRRIVAVVSAVNANKAEADYKASYLVSLASQEIKDFIGSWPAAVASQAKDGKPPEICGIDLNTSPCRPNPP